MFSLLLISLWKFTIVDVVFAAAVLCFRAVFWWRYFDTVRLLSLLCPSLDGHHRWHFDVTKCWAVLRHASRWKRCVYDCANAVIGGSPSHLRTKETGVVVAFCACNRSLSRSNLAGTSAILTFSDASRSLSRKIWLNTAIRLRRFPSKFFTIYHSSLIIICVCKSLRRDPDSVTLKDTDR